ncbi:hypothetical protein LJK88_35825 [Paenibacillus sp. P26]|nr:hypothetical protein LJK88_35825 [Paenibacillus sp. P26]
MSGVGYGSTSIDVSYGGKTDSLNLLVKDLNSELTVKQITVDNSAFALDSGKTATFKVTAEYLDGHTEDVTKSATYTNPNPEIADVSIGTITAKASGTANVVVSFKGALGDAATAQIRVSVNTPTVVAIEAETADWKIPAMLMCTALRTAIPGRLLTVSPQKPCSFYLTMAHQ